jgi:hypothetical protein
MKYTDEIQANYLPLCKRGIEGDFSGGEHPYTVEIPPAPLLQRGGIPFFNMTDYWKLGVNTCA